MSPLIKIEPLGIKKTMRKNHKGLWVMCQATKDTKDSEVECLLANLKDDASALHFASASLLENKEFMLRAVTNSSGALSKSKSKSGRSQPKS